MSSSDEPRLQPLQPLPNWEQLTLRAQVPTRARLHEAWRAAELATRAWVRRHKLATNRTARLRLRRARMSRLVGRFYPDASTQGLCLATDALSWAFVLDDIGDESPDGRDASRMAKRLGPLERVLDTRDASALQSDALASGLYDLDARVAGQCTPTQAAAFRDGVREFFAGLVWEAGNRQQGRTPPLEEFVEMRPAAGAATMFIALLEILGDYEVPAAWRATESAQRLETAARNCMCWVNDLYSIVKELQHGDVHNLVLVTAAAQEVSLPVAAERALVRYNEEIALFGRLSAAAQLPVEARAFVRGLADMIAGTRAWTLESARYRGNGDPITT